MAREAHYLLWASIYKELLVMQYYVIPKYASRFSLTITGVHTESSSAKYMGHTSIGHGQDASLPRGTGDLLCPWPVLE